MNRLVEARSNSRRVSSRARVYSYSHRGGRHNLSHCRRVARLAVSVRQAGDEGDGGDEVDRRDCGGGSRGERSAGNSDVDERRSGEEECLEHSHCGW